MTMRAADPYLLPPRSVISFSGGRTSGYLLWHVLRAFGGSLPPDRVVVFCNTGKEREETLAFVRDCSELWGVPVRWLEYRRTPDAEDKHGVVEVDFASASRNGSPFREVIAARNFLPNPVMRFCTAEMKIRTTNRFVRRLLGWPEYANAIGLRADEPKRVAKLLKRRTVRVERTLFGDLAEVERGASHPPGESPLCPLADAGVSNAEVLSFWKGQHFDLGLPVDPKTGRTLGGNCDLCFLKGTRTIIDAIAARPQDADWWVETESLIVGRDRPGTERFRHDRAPYAELRRVALGLVPAPLFTEADYEGMACGEQVECNCTD